MTAADNGDASHRRAVIALTLLAAALHFVRLTHPTLWIDEGSTFIRVNGSYAQLLDRLREDGFLPLLYEMYWLLGKCLYLSPVVMRITPALAGTAMVPACYFLGRQLVSPRHGLALAALAACSAYVGWYARDAEMYMELWLALTLHIACLIWWLRSRKRLAWLCWVAAGVAAAGLHAAALIIIALEPLFFLLLTRPRWRSALLLVAGLAIILSGPASFYFGFNQWIHRSGGLAPVFESETGDKPPEWKNSGLTWIDTYNHGLSGSDLMLDTASAFVLGCEWPRGADTPVERTTVYPWVRPAMLAAGTLLAAALAAGAVGAAGRLAGPRPGWARASFVTAAWIVLPVYGVFYCRSFHDAVPPWYWFLLAWRALGPAGWAAAAGGALLIAGVLRARPGLTGLTRCAAAAAAGLAGAGAMLASRTPDGIGAIFDPTPARWLAAAALALAIPSAWRASGESTRKRLAQAARLAAAALAIFALCAAAFGIWRLAEYGVGKFHPKFQWESLWFPRYLGIVWPALALAVVTLILRLPGRALRAAALASLLLVNLAGAVARIAVDSEPPLDVAARDIWAAHGDLTVRVAITGKGNWMNQSSGSYYLCYAAGLRLPPRIIGAKPFLKRFDFWTNPSAKQIKDLLKPGSKVVRVVAWDRRGRNETYNLKRDKFKPLLDAGWRVVEQSQWQLRQTRGWRRGDVMIRRVLVRPPKPEKPAPKSKMMLARPGYAQAEPPRPRIQNYFEQQTVFV